jgi:hypothetical protein
MSWVCADCRHGKHGDCPEVALGDVCWCYALRHRMHRAYMSRGTHAARLWSLITDRDMGYTRRDTVRLLWSHVCGLVKP